MSEPSRELLASIPPLRRARLVRCLGGGRASDSWLLHTGGRDLVLRIDRPLARVLGLDREAEWAVLETAHRARLAPEPVWRDASRGLLLTAWLPGPTWRAADLDDPSRLDVLAGLLRRVHALPVDGSPSMPKFDPVASAQGYADAAGLGDDDPRLSTVRSLAADCFPPGLECRLCHMDPHAGNVIGDLAEGMGDLRLIDWEYAAAGDPLFDLAVVTLYHELPPSAASRLLDAWNDGHEPMLADRFEAMCQLYATLADLWEAAVSSS